MTKQDDNFVRLGMRLYQKIRRRVFQALFGEINTMTSLTFYGGVNEIGGNKILLEDKDTKVFLDFGLSFGTRGTFLMDL